MNIKLRLVLIGLLSSAMQLSMAAPPAPVETTSDTPNPNKEIIQTDPVIQPEVKRREVKQSDVNTENFEIGAYVGFLSIEDFGTSAVYGLRLDYHITEDFFVHGVIGQSKAGTTSFERLGGGVTLLNDSQRDYLYYSVAIGYNLLPGEAFVTRDTTFNTSLYLIVGAGNTEFAGDDFFTITWGAGYAITANDWMAVHMDFRDHMFDIAITGEDKTSHNLEATIGLTFYF